MIGNALADPAALCTIGERARSSIPIAWETIMENVVARYTALMERSQKGELRHRHDVLRGILAERMHEWQKLRESARISSKKG